MCQAVVSSYHFPAWAEQRVGASMCAGASATGSAQMMVALWGGQAGRQAGGQTNQSTAHDALLVRRAVCRRRWTRTASELRL